MASYQGKAQEDLDKSRDYSGVPTRELAAVYKRYADCDHRTFAERIGMDERDFKKVVVTQNYSFTGLGVADEIVNGLGLNLSALIATGELTVVPARESRNAAKRMVEDEFWAKGLEAPNAEDVKERVDALLRLRKKHCIPTEAQEDRLRRDSERSAARLARLRSSGAAVSTVVALAATLGAVIGLI